MMSIREMDAADIQGIEAFQRSIAEPCLPVAIRGACSAWPVARAAAESPEALAAYLSRFDNGRTAQAFVGSTDINGRYYYAENFQGFNFAREDMSLGEALRRILLCARDPDLGSVYLGSVQAQTHAPGFGQDNRPGFLPAATGPRLWLGNASKVSCHYDTFDNLACAVAGRRTFTLFPPEAVSRLYVGPIDNTMAGPPVGLAVESERDDPRYPRFEEIRDTALTVDLHPGDCLYLPKLWWHQVEAREQVNLLVNYWWDGFSSGPDAPLTAMMLAMIAIAERPEEERKAWRAFFDHYVFREEGHPLRHLPEEQHGILGPLAKGNYGRIRAMVMQMLRNG
jgi:hypothetical protein